MKTHHPAAPAAIPTGSALSIRTLPHNPNHRLRWNSQVCETDRCSDQPRNATWWHHSTVHRPDYTKQCLGVPLEISRLHHARVRYDSLLASLSDKSKETA